MANGFRFPPYKGDRPSLPIYVFGAKKGHIGVATPEMPAELVVGASFRIGFAVDDGLMLLRRDCEFWAVDHLGPVRLRQNRLVYPAQLQCEVVESAKKDVGG